MTTRGCLGPTTAAGGSSSTQAVDSSGSQDLRAPPRRRGGPRRVGGSPVDSSPSCRRFSPRKPPMERGARRGPCFCSAHGLRLPHRLAPLSAGPSGQPLTRHHGAPRLLAPPLFGFGCLRRGGLGFGRRQRLRRRSPPEPSTLAAANPAASTGAGILDPRSARTAHLPLHWFCSLRDCGKLQICAILQPWSP